MDKNLLYLKKYFSELHLQRKIHFYFLKDYIKTKKKRMGLWQRLQYRVYRVRYGFDSVETAPDFLTVASDGSTVDPRTWRDWEFSLYHPHSRPRNSIVDEKITVKNFWV